ncbi:MAG: hypothetical protein QF886_21410, partial [Planctomycetota bacterium]|nr:hypothetical protein [Planctomycetota bacterium]
MRSRAIRGLAAIEHANTPEVLLSKLKTFNPNHQQEAIGTLSSRPNSCIELLDAIEKKTVSIALLTAFTVRQMLKFESEEINDRLNRVWGVIRTTPGEKAAEIARYKTILAPGNMKSAH